MELKRSILSDILAEVIDHRGKTPKKLGGDWSDKGYRALSAKNIKNGNLVQEDSINILPQDLYSKWMKVPIQRGDILLTSEAPLGEHMIWNSDEKIVLSQRLFALRFNTEIIDPYYAHYYISSKEYQHELTSRQSGSTVSGIKQSQLLETVFKYPPLPKQKAIAEVLSSLDDKIELLKKQNETLEALAQTMFRQWFIEEADDSWDEGILNDVLTVKGGATPSTKSPEYWGGGIAWTSPRDITTLNGIHLFQTEKTLTPLGLSKVSSGLLPKGTLLMSSRAPVGVLAFSEIDVAVNQGYIAITDDKILDRLFIYCWLKENIDIVHAYSNGSTFMEISKKSFKSIKCLIPPISKHDKFVEFVSPLFEKIKVNEKSVLNLSQTRDTLLPKLMSGQVRVKLD